MKNIQNVRCQLISADLITTCPRCSHTWTTTIGKVAPKRGPIGFCPACLQSGISYAVEYGTPHVKPQIRD